MLHTTRMLMAIVAGSSVLVPLTVLPSQSRASVIEVSGALCIGAWSLVQPNAAIAALASTGLAVTGGYIAFFHSPKLLLFNGSVAVGVASTAVLRLAHEAKPATAASAFWISAFLNLSVPLGIWGMSRAIEMYAQRSEQDALTGLLNRCAFSDAVSNRLANPPPSHTYLAVAMVDLDNFKRINDTQVIWLVTAPCGQSLTCCVSTLRRTRSSAAPAAKSSWSR